jgi:hypothetical protein
MLRLPQLTSQSLISKLHLQVEFTLSVQSRNENYDFALERSDRVDRMLILPFYSQLKPENLFDSESLKSITYSKAEMSADRI